MKGIQVDGDDFSVQSKIQVVKDEGGLSDLTSDMMNNRIKWEKRKRKWHLDAVKVVIIQPIASELFSVRKRSFEEKTYEL